jgi:hypothetical protein
VSKCHEKKQAAVMINTRSEEVATEEDDEEMCTLHATWEALMCCPREYKINIAVDGNLKLEDNDIMLDNHANISMHRPGLIYKMRWKVKNLSRYTL